MSFQEAYAKLLEHDEPTVVAKKNVQEFKGCIS